MGLLIKRILRRFNSYSAFQTLAEDKRTPIYLIQLVNPKTLFFCKFSQVCSILEFYSIAYSRRLIFVR